MLRSLTQKIAPFIARNLQNVLTAALPVKSFHLFSLPCSGLQIPSLTNKFINGPAKCGLLSPSTPLVEQIAGFKVKGKLRRRCKDCYFVMRQERLYVICKTHPRHKQMAMKKRDYKSWILTHATQSKVRPY